MRKAVDKDLVALAEQYRDQLPPDFQRHIDALTSDLSQERPFTRLTAKGGGCGESSNARIIAAVLDEVSLFLCADDARYAGLRNQGRKLGKDVVHFIAGIVVGTLGLTTGVATGCVAFVVLACSRIGVGAFCRLHPPPAPRAVRTTKAPVRTRSARRTPSARDSAEGTSG